MADSIKTSGIMRPVAASDALVGSTKTVDMAGMPLPALVTLRSADPTRRIEVSTDGGTEYETPIYDAVSATRIAVVLNSAVSHVRFTGVAADAWSIR